MADYSKTIFAKGIVCFNTNNNTKCVVIDGNQGSENDRCSRVIEKVSNGLIIHTPPNRALVPTGEYIDIGIMENTLTVKKGERWILRNENL